MILNKKVFVKVGTKSFSWYRERGYDAKCGQLLEISIDDITSHSSAIVDVECQYCKCINKKKYFDFIYSISNNTEKKYYCSICSHKNKKITNNIKYGCDSPLENLDIIKKSRTTLIKKYGVDNISKLNNIREDRSISMKENSMKYNSIINYIYGSNVSKLNWIKEKKKQTNLIKWGVENPMQNIQIFEKSQKNGKRIKLHQIGIWYRGSYEKDFLDFCFENKIEVSKGPSIEYKLDDKRKYYHSDFFISDKNLVVEIKSHYYYYKYLEINIAKRNATLNIGHNHIFIIDKDYVQFKEYL